MEEAIEAVGEDCFFANEQNEEYKELPFPPCFVYLIEIFLELYAFAGIDGITWQDIDSYCRIRKVTLTQTDVDYLIKIRTWVSSQIAKMKEEASNENRKDIDDE